MTAMQDQLDVLSTKFDKIYTNQEHWPFGHSGQKGGEFLGAALEGEVPIWGEEAFIIQQLFKFLLYVVLFMIIVLCFG